MGTVVGPRWARDDAERCQLVERSSLGSRGLDAEDLPLRHGVDLFFDLSRRLRFAAASRKLRYANFILFYLRIILESLFGIALGSVCDHFRLIFEMTLRSLGHRI